MKIIQSFLKHRPSRDYIVNETNLAWLQLSMPVPVEQILAEFSRVSNLVVDHRSEDRYSNLSNVGWKSLTLHGVSHDVTTASNATHTWTDIAERCPVTVGWLKEHFEIDSTTGRIRFMILEPGGYILPHQDRDQQGLREINIAITNPAGCTFRFLDRGIIPFEPGTAFIIDTSKRHFVINNSNQSRLHMIVHSTLKPGIIEQSYADCFYNQ